MNAPRLAPSASTLWRRHSLPDRSRPGFTTLELLIVLGVVGVLGAMAVLITPQALKTSRADGGMLRVVSALRTAREQAIGQRRNVRVAFNAPNQIVVSRVEVPSGTLTTLTTVSIEDGMRFLQFAGVPDTPDGFGNGSVTSFGAATSVSFTSEGELVDQHGDPINGTIFLGRYNDTISARAVTIFGPTALIRQWRWNGRQWTS